MDGVSGPASTLAILGYAAKTTHFLYTFFRDVVRAAEDVQRAVALLDVLDKAFQAMHALCQRPGLRLELVPWLEPRLKEYLQDVRSVKSRVGEQEKLLRGGSLQRMRMKVRWAFSAENWLGRFFSRVALYHSVFTFALGIIQIDKFSALEDATVINIQAATLSAAEAAINLGNGSVQGTSPTAIENTAEHERDLLDRDLSAQKTSSTDPSQPPANGQPMSGYEDPKIPSEHLHSSRSWDVTTDSPSVRAVGLLAIRMLIFRYWLGPVHARRWDKDRAPVSNGTIIRSGLVCCLSFRLLWRLLGQLDCTFVAMQETMSQSVSIRCNLSFRRVVPYYAEILELARSGLIEPIEELVQAGKASYSDISPDGTNLLHIAAGKNDLRLVSHLLAKGLDANTINDDGESPLHIAITRARNYNVSRVIIESGGDMCSRRLDGKTPAHSFFNDVVKQVLICHRSSIDLSTIDEYGMTPLHYLSWSSKTTIQDIKPLLRSGHGPLNVRDNDGRSVLHYAAQRGNLQLLAYYLAQTLRVTASDADSSGRTVLHYAVESRRVGAIDLVCKHGGNLWGRDHLGHTPLHAAALRGNLDAVKRVLFLGSAGLLACRDLQGMTPMQLGDAYGQIHVSTYLKSLPDVVKRSEQSHTESPRKSWPANGYEEPGSLITWKSMQHGLCGLGGRASINIGLTILALGMLFGVYLMDRVAILDGHQGSRFSVNI